jgi:hypothetical protein
MRSSEHPVRSALHWKETIRAVTRVASVVLGNWPSFVTAPVSYDEAISQGFIRQYASTENSLFTTKKKRTRERALI